ncbi:MAG: GNAT family N-acetyltransferase [Pseudomonadota bacterium]|nr:GNAT family N-acetyltransferase [Pseudomonadota bacterium]
MNQVTHDKPNDTGHDIEISLLRLRDAHALAPLIAAYGQALKRGAPRQPDQYYAEQLLQDRVGEFLGARLNGKLVGFILFYDLPEPVSGKRAGQADHIYVHHDHRGKGIAKALVDVLADLGSERGWSKLMLNAPRRPETGKRVFEAVAEPADWSSFVVHFRGE